MTQTWNNSIAAANSQSGSQNMASGVVMSVTPINYLSGMASGVSCPSTMAYYVVEGYGVPLINFWPAEASYRNRGASWGSGWFLSGRCVPKLLYGLWANISSLPFLKEFHLSSEGIKLMGQNGQGGRMTFNRPATWQALILFLLLGSYRGFSTL